MPCSATRSLKISGKVDANCSHPEPVQNYQKQRSPYNRSGVKTSARMSGSSPYRGHCVLFLRKRLYSHSALSTQIYKWVSANFMLGGNPSMD